MRKILVAVQGKIRDKIVPAKVIEEIHSIGEPVLAPSEITPENYLESLKDVEAVITSWGTPKLTVEMKKQLKNLKILGHAAGSIKSAIEVDVLDHGSAATNGAPSIATSVAEMVVGMMVSLLRSFLPYNASMHQGKWEEDVYANDGVAGQKVGLVGFGYVAKEVVRFLKPFDVEVYIHDPFVSEEVAKQYGAKRLELDELLKTCYIVSLHAPLLPATHHMINAERLKLLQDGAVLINSSGGGLVDEEALYEQAKNGRIRAALDCYDPEPPEENFKLKTLPNILLLPHIGGPTHERFKDMALAVINDFKVFFDGKQPKNLIKKSALAVIA